MIQYFFSTIPRLLFEPVAVVALLGCITTLLFFHKKNNPFFYIILLSICLMFFWRVSFYSIMLSTRYAAVILYPAAIFSVLFCFHVKESVQWIDLRFFHLDKSWFRILCTVMPYFLLFCLALPCVIKTLRFNPYADYRIKLCKTLSREIEGKTVFLYVEGGHLGQVAYYTGLDMKVPKILRKDRDGSFHGTLKKKLEETKNYFATEYFVFSLKRGEAEPDAQCLGINPETGKWECIYREYTSRRKNRECVLYRFTPAHSNIEVWEKEISESSPDNLCKNGGFEQLLSKKELEQRIAYYKKIEASDFYLTPGRLFPAQWWLGVLKPVNGHSSEMALTAESPLAGKYSLELKSSGPEGYVLNSAFIPKRDCIFSGFIRAEAESFVRIISCYWNIEKKKTHYISSCQSHLQPGKTYRFSIPVRLEDIPEKDKNIFIIIAGNGHILVDNVEFIRAQKKEKHPQSTPDESKK